MQLRRLHNVENLSLGKIIGVSDYVIGMPLCVIMQGIKTAILSQCFSVLSNPEQTTHLDIARDYLRASQPVCEGDVQVRLADAMPKWKKVDREAAYPEHSGNLMKEKLMIENVLHDLIRQYNIERPALVGPTGTIGYGGNPLPPGVRGRRSGEVLNGTDEETGLLHAMIGDVEAEKLEWSSRPASGKRFGQKFQQQAISAAHVQDSDRASV
jgi:hypothetical protein